MVKANHSKIDSQKLTSLAAEVREKGDQQILEFLNFALNNQPFPI